MLFKYGMVPDENPAEKIYLPYVTMIDARHLDSRAQQILMALGFASQQPVDLSQIVMMYENICGIFGLQGQDLEICYYVMLDAPDDQLQEEVHSKCERPPQCMINLQEPFIKIYKEKMQPYNSSLEVVRNRLEILIQEPSVAPARIETLRLVEKH
eukprot:TRINITY_DN6523_c0_g2_i7.p2 TRINITY_DN6523_c0_g2~~TRINITY_DN6523_c0_g2_i7.p2  ORF type:complete len:155 (+),score=22.35 TRINITY_DN6523_c0_g2_i7:501-965(+)